MKSIAKHRTSDRLLPLREAAEIAGRHWQYVRRAAVRRELPYVQDRPNAKIFIWHSDLLAWLERSFRPALREA